MSEYTPSIDQIRMAWITQRWNQAGQLRSEGSDAEFDRALAAHDEQVRAAERERCARIAESQITHGRYSPARAEKCRDIAEAIRAVPAEQKENKHV